MELHLGDKVLVRRSHIANDPWVPAIFGYQLRTDTMCPYVVFGGGRFSDCILLEGNEGLIGTSFPAHGQDTKPAPSIQHADLFEEVEANIYDDDNDLMEPHWKKAWFVWSSNNPDDMYPHKVLLDEDKETYYVEDYCIRPVKKHQK